MSAILSSGRRGILWLLVLLWAAGSAQAGPCDLLGGDGDGDGICDDGSGSRGRDLVCSYTWRAATCVEACDDNCPWEAPISSIPDASVILIFPTASAMPASAPTSATTAGGTCSTRCSTSVRLRADAVRVVNAETCPPDGSDQTFSVTAEVRFSSGYDCGDWRVTAKSGPGCLVEP
jgi:hypothetical protein